MELTSAVIRVEVSLTPKDPEHFITKKMRTRVSFSKKPVTIRRNVLYMVLPLPFFLYGTSSHIYQTWKHN